jgi:hypothetical protein
VKFRTKQRRGTKGNLRAVIGITQALRVEPLRCFTSTASPDVERTVKNRLREAGSYKIPFIYDGEPGLDNFIADVAEARRFRWHGPQGLYHVLWKDGVRKKESQPETDKIKQMIGIELPEAVKFRYESSKEKIKELIQTFYEKGYRNGAAYLEYLSGCLFTHIELWLKTGFIAFNITSLLDGVFREIGHRLMRIACGWSDSAVTNLSEIVLIRQYARDKC